LEDDIFFWDTGELLVSEGAHIYNSTKGIISPQSKPSDFRPFPGQPFHFPKFIAGPRNPSSSACEEVNARGLPYDPLETVLAGQQAPFWGEGNVAQQNLLVSCGVWGAFFLKRLNQKRGGEVLCK